MQKLPIDLRFFDSLSARNFLYVDKTQHIYRLINTGTFVFLSRPRRFGKSLLVSTLQHLFQGHKQLFQGLWIEDKIDWQPRPGLVINFNDLDYREQPLATALTNHLDRLAAENQIQLHSEHYKEKFQELIVRLSEEQKIVLLIDEYDRAITDLLENEQKVAEHIATLKNFYSVLKTTAANHIHWTFLTGISKYGKLSLFSDLNNLLDITLDERFAALLGYTQEELEHYFPERIDALAANDPARVDDEVAIAERRPAGRPRGPGHRRVDFNLLRGTAIPPQFRAHAIGGDDQSVGRIVVEAVRQAVQSQGHAKVYRHQLNDIRPRRCTQPSFKRILGFESLFGVGHLHFPQAGGRQPQPAALGKLVQGLTLARREPSAA